MSETVWQQSFKPLFRERVRYQFERGPGGRYRSVSVLAVLSIVVGFFSILTAFSWLFHIIPIVAVAMALGAKWRISRRPEALVGNRLATLALVLTFVLWGVGTAGLIYLELKEVPHGYTPLTFEMLAPPNPGAENPLPPDIEKLEGEKIYLKGHMYPGRQSIGLKSFLLVPTLAHCKFCASQIPLHEIVQVELVGDLTTDYTSAPTGVGGRLRIDKDVAKGKKFGQLYKIEADYIR
jgi:hypothetical protein